MIKVFWRVEHRYKSKRFCPHNPSRENTHSHDKMSSAPPPDYCVCDSDAYSGIIREVFRVCAYAPIEYIGFLSGVFSVVFWFVCQFPQILKNYRLKTSEGLSMHFLLLWATGDSCNLIACLLTGDQTPIQIYTAVYFLMSDSVLIPSLCCIRKDNYEEDGLNIGGEMMRDVGVQPNSSSPITNDVMSMIDENISTIQDEDKGNNDSCGDDVHPPSTPKHRNQKKNKKKKPVSPSTYISGFLGAGVSVYSFRSFSSSGTMNSMSGATRTLQSATGCLNHAISKNQNESSLSVIGTHGDVLFRWESVSDFKNRRRKSCEGVSMLMFFFAISANITYGISIIFMKNFRWMKSSIS